MMRQTSIVKEITCDFCGRVQLHDELNPKPGEIDRWFVIAKEVMVGAEARRIVAHACSIRCAKEMVDSGRWKADEKVKTN